jgi:hypothetical protein
VNSAYVANGGHIVADGLVAPAVLHGGRSFRATAVAVHAQSMDITIILSPLIAPRTLARACLSWVNFFFFSYMAIFARSLPTESNRTAFPSCILSANSVVLSETAHAASPPLERSAAPVVLAAELAGSLLLEPLPGMDDDGAAQAASTSVPRYVIVFISAGLSLEVEPTARDFVSEDDPDRPACVDCDSVEGEVPAPGEVG